MAKKENVIVLKESQHHLRRDRIDWEALRVLTRLDEAGYKAYLCGGGVRDLLLDRTPKDFDIATDARPEEVKKIFHRDRHLPRALGYPAAGCGQGSVADAPQHPCARPDLCHAGWRYCAR